LTAVDDMAPQVRLRPATPRDAALLLVWRNDPVAVRFSVTGRAVDPDEHASWMASRLADPATRLWIAEEDGVPAGQVRVHLEAGTGTVSVAVAPNRRGRGVGSAMLRAMLKEAERDPETLRLRALAHAENTASIRAFERTGFRREGSEEGGFVVLERALGPKS
jgi:RimJ/RimL family protein N-acetyltransferase